jgi:hypothetical protein
MSSRTRRHILLILLTLPGLSACGVTQYQRFMDMQEAALADLHSPAMERRIADAQAYQRSIKQAAK